MTQNIEGTQTHNRELLLSIADAVVQSPPLIISSSEKTNVYEV
jgi:hypothetical protein